MTYSSAFTAISAGLALVLLAQGAAAGVTEGALLSKPVSFGNGGGGPSGVQNIDDMVIIHRDGFKGAKRVAISVFNVAFPNENQQSAKTKTSNSFGIYSAIGTAMKETITQSKSMNQHTTLEGVDAQTRQRIADAAYNDFVAQLTAAGYEVVSTDDLAKLTPEYTTWTAAPNFSDGRFGTYVAPDGRKLYWLMGDQSKRDMSSQMDKEMSMFRVLDRTQAVTRSPYLAHDGKIGIIAVTLVVDYGTYKNTGDTKKYNSKMEVSYTPGVTAQGGTHIDSATLAEYWGPDSGGFPAVAFLAAPLTSDVPFANIGDNAAKDGDSQPIVHADPAAFEKAAAEVTQAANAKLIATMAAAR